MTLNDPIHVNQQTYCFIDLVPRVFPGLLKDVPFKVTISLLTVADKYPSLKMTLGNMSKFLQTIKIRSTLIQDLIGYSIFYGYYSQVSLVPYSTILTKNNLVNYLIMTDTCDYIIFTKLNSCTLNSSYTIIFCKIVLY